MSDPPQRARPAAGLLVADARRVLSTWPAGDARRSDLPQRIGGFLTEHGPAAASRDLRIGHLTASAVVLDADRTSVLLTLHALAGLWLQLGGHPEPVDRTLADAALREATEESGITGLVVDPVPLGLDWHRVTCRDSRGSTGPSSHLDVTYLVLAPVGARPRISTESLDLRWFAVDGLPDGTDDTVRTLVAAARERSRQHP